MENPRPEKVAVVSEVREKLGGADAVLITEYRGLTVKELASLRSSIRPAGGEYKIYKNTLVRLAAAELGLDIADQLTGPTALAIISSRADGSSGDIAVAKAIVEFAKGQPLLVTKGGILGDQVLDAAAAKALASLPTASEVYSRLAGSLNSGARGLAASVNGVHRSIALVLQACIDAGAFAGDPPAPEAPQAAEPVAEAEAEAPVEAAEAAEPEAPAEQAAEAVVIDDEPTAEPEAPAVAEAEVAEPQATEPQATESQETEQNEQETGETDVQG